MKMSCALITSAQAKAQLKKMVFRAGTYVIGIPLEISFSLRFLGTSIAAVRAEAANCAQINLDYPVLFHAERLRDPLSGGNFNLVSLAVAEGESKKFVTFFFGNR